MFNRSTAAICIKGKFDLTSSRSNYSSTHTSVSMLFNLETDVMQIKVKVIQFNIHRNMQFNVHECEELLLHHI
jgi:hypothetical protein